MPDENENPFPVTYYRFRHNFASGFGKNNWEYRDIRLGSMSWDEWRDEEARELMSEYSFTDRYRGVDIEVVDAPPKAWVAEQLDQARRSIIYFTERAAWLEAMLKEMPDPLKEATT